MDIWWEIYKKVFLKMTFKERLFIGYAVLTIPPAILLAIVALIYTTGLSRVALLISSLVGIVALFYFSVIFSRNMGMHISKISGGIKDIQLGNLAYSLDEIVVKDEIGELVNHVTSSFRAMSNTLQETNDMIQGIPEPIFVIDKDHKIVTYNKNFQK